MTSGPCRRRPLGALVTALTAGVVASVLASGCAPALRQAGAVQAGAVQAGAVQAGAVQAGAVEASLLDTAEAPPGPWSRPNTEAAATPAGPLAIESAVVPKMTDNFNPFTPGTPLNLDGVTSFVYEPLLQVDQLQVDQYYPWLAQSWTFSAGGQTITFTLRQGVHWADGSALTAADVAYSFGIAKADRVRFGDIPIVSAVASGTYTFELTLSQPAYSYLYDIAMVPIVKAGFGARSDPVTYVVRDPDGTGPYGLSAPDDVTSSRVVLTARRGYWQRGEPTVHQLVFPAFADTAAVLQALRDGALGWAGIALPSAQDSYVAKAPGLDHYWYPPVDCIALVPNLASGPTAQLAVREAISEALDREAVSKEATSGSEPPATSTSGLVLPMDSAFASPASEHDIDITGNVPAARETMRSAGYHLGRTGYWTSAAGSEVRFDVVEPEGSLLLDEATVVGRQLRSAGFGATVDGVTTSRWDQDLSEGRFGASLLPSAEGPSPFYMYAAWLGPSLLSHGRAVGGDYGRLGSATSPALAAKVTAYLDRYTDSPSDSAEAVGTTKALAALVAKDFLVLPVVYGVSWGEFSTRSVTGWPGSTNPYEPAAPEPPFEEYTVLQLSPAGR